MTHTNKVLPKSKRILTSVDEFEQLFFPRAYQEKQDEQNEDDSRSLGVAVDFLGEVHRQLPKKKSQQKVARAKS